MCGIAGIVALHPESSVDPARLDRMLGPMLHRGPDDAGSAVWPAVALGMRRLSIIDLAGGHQPIANEDGTIHVVCNGEIYNFAELRAELIAAGHRFATHGDTEVLVHGYEQWGLSGLLERVAGMFAFALHDTAARRVVLVRDRLGIKPLLYAVRDGRLWFASAMSSLLAAGAASITPDPVGVRLYLHNQFVPGARTVLADVRRLPPACYLEVRDGRLAEPTRYWAPPVEDPSPAPFEAWVERLRDTLDGAVRAHLVSDVEVGVFLSGGLDSSVVLGLMARHQATPVRAFSIGFGGHRDFDESPFARRAAERFGAILEHRDFTADDVAAIAPAMIAELEEPLGDPACLPTFLLAQMASRQLKVVLSGEGADELFAGYDYYARFGAVGRQRAGRRSVLAALLGALRPRPRGWAQESSAVSGFPRAMSSRFVESLLPEFGADAEVASFQDEIEESALAGRGAASPLARASLVDIAGWLPDDLLAKVDRTTMAHSLEARVPFLDHRVVELACRMPADAKLRGGAGKAVMRAAFADLLGSELVTRRKHGFNLPMHRWLRGPLSSVLDSTLVDPGSAGASWLDRRSVRALLEAHRRGVGDFARALWSLHVLVAWFGDAARQVVAANQGADGHPR